MLTPHDTGAGRVQPDKESKSSAAVDDDFYRVADLLNAEDQALLRRVRTFMEEKVAPVITRHWARAEFPFELISDYAALGIAGVAYDGHGCAGRSTLLDGFVMLELARIDCSIATFHGVHSGLAMGTIHLCGSEEQKRRWLPAMRRCEKIGAFGLTEPEVGSGAARGLKTTARRDGDSWVLNGEKAWIGNATFADVTVIWARDIADGQVKGFLVEKGMPGFTTEKMERKIALRAVQNARIRLEDCRVGEPNRLANAHSFKDTARVLRMTLALCSMPTDERLGHWVRIPSPADKAPSSRRSETSMRASASVISLVAVRVKLMCRSAAIRAACGSRAMIAAWIAACCSSRRSRTPRRE